MNVESRFVYQKIIQAPVDLIYRAFTTSLGLHEWLCDIATTNPEEGGRIFMAWNHGYYTSGHFLKLIPDQLVSFAWIGKGEPSWTQVDVTISPVNENDRYLVELRHLGIGPGEEWETAREEIHKGWDLGLENLRSILEEGRDLRVMNRPLIGIYPSDIAELSDTSREAMGFTLKNGVLIEDIVPDYGADQAGIVRGDVIVAIDGKKVESLRSLQLIINDYKPGDVIEVEAFRGQEKMTFHVSTTPQIDQVVPKLPEDLAKKIEAKGMEALTRLEAVLDGVTDAEASYAPGPEEWSAKETLVHMIHSEHELHVWINDIVSGQERFYDDWPGEKLFRIRATLTSYPTVDDLLEEFRRSLKETVACVAFIDPKFTRQKITYWRLGTEFLGEFYHISDHIRQIENNIKAARSASSS